MDVKEAGQKGGNTTKKNHPDLYKNLTKKRFAGMSPAQISEYMKRVRAKKSPTN